jgi:hypothetical protein
LKPEFNCP